MVLIFSMLLIGGIVGGQVFDLSGVHTILELTASICLAYIMIEVGLEFSMEKRGIRSYGWDAAVATTAAVIPALLWFVYFLVVMHESWRPALLTGLSSAPTSAGVLFAMMMAAGLGATWVFRKARVLAVLDDLVAILLLTPLQIAITGFQFESVVLLVLVGFFIFASFRWQHALRWPAGEWRIFIYGLVLAWVVLLIKRTTHIHLEVLIPAFMLGCLIHRPAAQPHSSGERSGLCFLDPMVKGAFMLLVGLSFPKMEIDWTSWQPMLVHLVILTVLANLGKCIPALCYRREASLKERLALSVAMFPRGEVGAAVLLIGLGYGFGGYVATLAMLGLALNLILTGVFIAIVMRFLR